MATMIEELNLKFHLILINFHVNSPMWLMVTVLHRAGLDSPQMCSKSFNSSLVVVHRYPHRLHSHFSQVLPNTLGCNKILHSSKSPHFLPWDINSFGLKQLSSICLANSYFAFGAQLSSHYLTSGQGPSLPCFFLFQICHLKALEPILSTCHTGF